jgi:hypothetical protein
MALLLNIPPQSKPFFMKKLVFMFVVSALFITSIKAQTTRFGFKAGPNSNTFYLKSEGTGGSDSRFALTKPGFHVGGIVDLGFSDNFSLQPHLLFAMKGGKIQQSGSETEFTFLTIDLPINLLYNNNGFFIGAGPNLSYGVSGKGKATGEPEVDLYEDDALGTGTKFKRFEVGVNALMGYRFPSGLLFSTNFTPGLTDLVDEDASTTGTIKSSNTFWGFSIGYLFGGNTAKKK